MSTPPHLSVTEVEALGQFNAERSRGIVHEPAYASQMAELQGRFDRRMAYLDREIDRGEATLEVLRRSALPRWFLWSALVVAVGGFIVALVRAAS